MDWPRELVDSSRRPNGSRLISTPLQHASERVLAGCAGPYTIDYYASLRERHPRADPARVDRHDVIVGFPGETETTSRRLAAYFERSTLTTSRIPYSDRPRTPPRRWVGCGLER